MNGYRHTQVGWQVWLPVAVAALLTAIFGVLYETPQLYVVSALLVLAVVLFSTLTVVVDEKNVRIAFGVGLIRKSFPIPDIQSAAAVRNSWWNGWGIRYPAWMAFQRLRFRCRRTRHEER